MNTIPEFIIPRDEQKLTELFEDFLFTRMEKFANGEDVKKGAQFRLNNTDLELLSKTGITDRIFRRWFQTNFGYQSWTDAFEGETPRQEFSHHLSEFKNGGVLFSVGLEKINDEWKVIPKLLLKKDIEKAGGIFSYGLKKLEKSGTVPGFDFGFGKFVEHMKKVEKMAQTLPSYNPPKNEEEKWWRLFWEQSGANLSFNIGLELAEKDQLQIAIDIKKCLDQHIEKQGSGNGDFINIDELFYYLWDILRKTDKRLVSYDEMTKRNNPDEDEKMENKDYFYSTKVFYLLGHMFDEKILFPADKYFGAAECVWTDKNHFMMTFMDTILLLKNKLIHPALSAKMELADKKRMEYLKIPETSMNIEKTWFSPPTAFRILPSVKKYF